MIDVNVIPDPINVALQWGATLVLYLIVKKYIYAPVKEMLNKRQDKIMKDLNDAEAAAEEAFQLKTTYETKMNEAKQEGQRIVEESRKRGKEVQNQLIEEGKESAHKLLDNARYQIDVEKQQAFKEVKGATSEMAIAIAQKLIGKNLDTDTEDKLIDKFIEDLGKENV